MYHVILSPTYHQHVSCDPQPHLPSACIMRSSAPPTNSMYHVIPSPTYHQHVSCGQFSWHSLAVWTHVPANQMPPHDQTSWNCCSELGHSRLHIATYSNTNKHTSNRKTPLTAARCRDFSTDVIKELHIQHTAYSY